MRFSKTKYIILIIIFTMNIMLVFPTNIDFKNEYTIPDSKKDNLFPFKKNLTDDFKIDINTSQLESIIGNIRNNSNKIEIDYMVPVMLEVNITKNNSSIIKDLNFIIHIRDEYIYLTQTNQSIPEENTNQKEPKQTQETTSQIEIKQFEKPNEILTKPTNTNNTKINSATNTNTNKNINTENQTSVTYNKNNLKYQKNNTELDNNITIKQIPILSQNQPESNLSEYIIIVLLTLTIYITYKRYTNKKINKEINYEQKELNTIINGNHYNFKKYN